MDNTLEAKTADIHAFLLEHLSDELEDAERYYKYAVKAKHLGDHPLAASLIGIAKEENRHFEALMEIIEKNVPALHDNPLYPLLRSLEDWEEDMAKEMAAFR